MPTFLRALIVAALVFLIGFSYMDNRTRIMLLTRHIDETRPVIYILRDGPMEPPLPATLDAIPGYTAPEDYHLAK